jgi:hypothetical protein
MEHIANILPHVIPMTAPNGLSPVVQVALQAIASSQVPADILPYAVRWHIPADKYAQAQPFIKGLTLPAGGNNQTSSNGSWWNPATQNWVTEPIVLVKSYVTGDVLQQHLGEMLRGSYRMGQALGEQAIAIEILSNNAMLIIPTS